MDKESIINALFRRALGYDYSETSEELSDPPKIKINKKHMPPDISAIKLLLELDENLCSDMDDRRLEAERKRLLGELKASDKPKKSKPRD